MVLNFVTKQLFQAKSSRNAQKNPIKRLILLHLWHATVTYQKRLTARNVDRVLISESEFVTIPWPGIYIFNSSRISIKKNAFKSVAPRSLVFKHGQYLEVSHNALKVASALDVSQFPRHSRKIQHFECILAAF